MTIDVLASADADLRFQMEEAGVSADVQKAIYAEGFTSVRVFAGLEESREGVRAALKSSFKRDGNESPAMRKERYGKGLALSWRTRQRTMRRSKAHRTGSCSLPSTVPCA